MIMIKHKHERRNVTIINYINNYTDNYKLKYMKLTIISSFRAIIKSVIADKGIIDRKIIQKTIIVKKNLQVFFSRAVGRLMTPVGW